jgi:N-sulfoglucosamine sulfohydrolase
MPSSPPVPAPPPASILTGQHPFAAGTPRLHVPIPGDRKLVTHYLQKAGYFTASLGKWHTGENVIDQFDLVIKERHTTDHSQTGMEDWLPVLEHKLPEGKPFFVRLAAKDPHRPWTAEPIHQAKDMVPPAYIEFNNRNTPQKNTARNGAVLR